MLRILWSEANGAAEVEMCRDSGSGKVLCLAVKYCLRTVYTDKRELIITRCEQRIHDYNCKWGKETDESDEIIQTR